MKYIIFGSLINKGIMYFAFILFAREYGANNYGELSFVQVLIGYAIILGTYGLDKNIFKIFKNGDDLKNNIFNILFFKSLIYITTISIMFQYMENDKYYIQYACIGFIYLIDITYIYDYLEEYKTNVLFKSIPNLIFIFVLYLFLDDISSSIFLWFYFGALSVYITISYIYIFKKIKPKLNISIHRVINIFQMNYFIFLAAIASMLYNNLDQIMIKYFIDYTYLAYYSVAYAIYVIALTLDISVMRYFTPKLFKHVDNSEEENVYIKNIILFKIFYLVPLSVFIFNYSKEIVSFTYGAEYIASTIVLQIIMGQLLLNILSPLSLLILNKGDNKLFFLQILYGSILNFILNLWMIPSFGIEGSAYATVISALVVELYKIHKLNYYSKIYKLVLTAIGLLLIYVTIIYIINSILVSFLLKILLYFIFYIFINYIFYKKYKKQFRLERILM